MLILYGGLHFTSKSQRRLTTSVMLESLWVLQKIARCPAMAYSGRRKHWLCWQRLLTTSIMPGALCRLHRGREWGRERGGLYGGNKFHRVTKEKLGTRRKNEQFLLTSVSLGYFVKNTGLRHAASLIGLRVPAPIGSEKGKPFITLRNFSRSYINKGLYYGAKTWQYFGRQRLFW